MDTVEAIVAEMRAHLESGCACCQSAEFLDRLQSAHDAEVGALREQTQLADKIVGEGALWRGRAESAESRLREARSLLRETSAVAITMLYASHKADTLAEFSVDELGQVIEAGAPLLAEKARVEHVYRRAWDAAIDRAMEGEDG